MLFPNVKYKSVISKLNKETIIHILPSVSETRGKKKLIIKENMTVE